MALLPPLPPCPNGWEYERFPGAQAKLAERSSRLLGIVATLNRDMQVGLVGDIKPAHRYLFNGLTPEHFPYYAGHYRGEPLHCLDTLEVGIPSDPRVGHAADVVLASMDDFKKRVAGVATHLDMIHRLDDSFCPRELKFARTVEVLAALLVYFFEVHPFANGNGHMGRLLMVTMSARHGLLMNDQWHCILDRRNRNISSRP